MANIVEIRIPDIGDFAEVLVIELLVKRGEEVTLEQSLLTLESDKATLEVPSPFAGRIETLTVAVGDRVSKGSLIGTIATAAAEAPPHPRPPRRRRPSPLPVPRCAGVRPRRHRRRTGGYSAAFRAGRSWAEGGLWSRSTPCSAASCLNVGCIPSKALLHVAAVKEEGSGSPRTVSPSRNRRSTSTS